MANFWKSALRWLPGVIISLVAILLIIHFVDLNLFIAAVRSANYWLILLSLFLSFAWLMVRALSGALSCAAVPPTGMSFGP